ncbi:MAG: mannose-phosphate guanylyltransferase [Solirubrobacteraceae bacterium]|nr:mannose-phosphate guanylyltransferase [Solirubrobacteraceae bacterium]
MVLAAGRGMRMRPFTHEVPKPLLPVLGRSLMERVLDGLETAGFDDVVANLHHLPDDIREELGDRIAYRVEEKLLGTAGGVRNCADLLGAERFLVTSGSILADVDLAALVSHHEAAGGVATVAVARAADPREHTVVLSDSDGRVTGLQDRPQAAEALSLDVSCGIYVFEPGIFEYVAEGAVADWEGDVFPGLLDAGAAFHVHQTTAYWNGVATPDQLRAATFDSLTGAVRLQAEGDELDEGFTLGEGSSLGGVALIEPPVWVGRDVEIGSEVRLHGPLAIGDGARVGDGASLRATVLLPGAEVPPGAMVAGGVVK